MGDLTKNVIQGGFDTKFTVQSDFEDAIIDVLEQFDGKMSLAQVLGVLEIVKFGLIEGHGD